MVEGLVLPSHVKVRLEEVTEETTRLAGSAAKVYLVTEEDVEVSTKSVVKEVRMDLAYAVLVAKLTSL